MRKNNSEIKKLLKKLTKKELASIFQMRDKILDGFRNTPAKGKFIKHLGKLFYVAPGVFWPRPDSIPMIKNFKIANNDVVLDVCTGSGVIAINAALKGAKKVIAVDINPRAVEAARLNVKRFKLDKKVEVRKSNLFSGLKDGEKFDVITFNPPFYDAEVSDLIDRTMKDPGFKTTIKFFNKVRKHLKPGGRIYMAQANSGEVTKMLDLAEKAHFTTKLIGKKKMKDDSLEFYAFELA